MILTQKILSQFDVKNIVKGKTCFKSITNPSCIDLFITNKPLSFQNTNTLSTGLSDHHKMVITVLKVAERLRHRSREQKVPSSSPTCASVLR